MKGVQAAEGPAGVPRSSQSDCKFATVKVSTQRQALRCRADAVLLRKFDSRHRRPRAAFDLTEGCRNEACLGGADHSASSRQKRKLRSLGRWQRPSHLGTVTCKSSWSWCAITLLSSCPSWHSLKLLCVGRLHASRPLPAWWTSFHSSLRLR